MAMSKALQCYGLITSCRSASKLLKTSKSLNLPSLRFASEHARMMRIKSQSIGGPFMRDLAYHIMCGVVPAGLIIAYCNLCIGDAILCDYDPDVYEPEQHEFYKNPITRFFAKYIMEDSKVRYYKTMQAFEVSLRMERQVKFVNQIHQIQKMEDEGMMAVYYRPAITREMREDLDAWAEKQGLDTRPTEK